ncbi:MAG: SpoIIE family protein phosphatase [Clostridiales bacterium]
MKIRMKLFMAFLALSLLSLLLSTATGLYQLIKAKADVSGVYINQSEQLIATNIHVMTGFNADMAVAFAQNYSDILDNKLLSVTKQVLVIGDYLRGTYHNGVKTMSSMDSGITDRMIYMQPDVSFDSVNEEFQILQSALDLLYAATESDPNGGMYYYASESGFVMYGTDVVDFVSRELDLRQRTWYTQAAGQSGVCWTPIYTDARTGELNITCSAPVFDGDGRVLGVVACDILAEPLINIVIANDIEIIEYAFILDESGKELISSVPGKTLADYITDQSQRDVLTQKMLASTTNASLYNEDEIMAGYTLIATTNWKAGILIDYQKIIAPARRVEELTRNSGDHFRQYLGGRISSAILVSLTVTAFILISALLVSKRVAKSITKPLALLTDGAGNISEGNLEYRIEIKSGDEIETLADSFNTMTGKLRDYIENLAKITAENQRISTELNIATQIQMDMLPNIFPAFPGRKEFEIYAAMQPAKEIGGDFYDFFLIDDDHLGIVIADVSGKSIPAALFMVIAKTLINNRTRTKEEPQDVFANVNRQLREGNETAMFVTAWLGILEISTGLMTFVNAGHNPPLLKKAGGTYEYLKTKKGFVLGGMDGLSYTQIETQLEKGDMLYLYTDGVTEANNPAGELYGEKRLRDTLNASLDLTPPELLPKIKADIDSFAKGAPQFDDVTMLALLIN